MRHQKLIIIASCIILFTALLLLIIRDDLTIQPTPTTIPQIEITKEVHLTKQNLKNGLANGWTKNQDLIKFDHYPSVLPFPLDRLFDRFRIKMWSYYYIVTDKHIIGFSINQILNFGSALFMCYDHTQKDSQILKITDTSIYGYTLPPLANTKNLQAEFQTKRIMVKYQAPTNNLKLVNLKVPEFDFTATFQMKTKKDHQTITHVYPLTETHDSNYGYGSKKYSIQVKGVYKLGDTEYKLQNKAVGMLDHGRGTPPYKTMWIWGSICTILSDGRMLGLNMGAGDKAGINKATTDALFIDGKIHKLGAVGIEFNNQDVLQTDWKIKNVTDAKNGSKAAIDLTFVPERKIMSGKNYLLVKVDLMNIYGVFNGTVTLNDGEVIKLENIPGFMERNYARW